MSWSRLLGGALLAGGLLVVHAARAYDEAHQTGDDVRLEVDASGVARIEHTIGFHVVAGQKRTLDLVGIEPNAVADPTAALTKEDGSELVAHVAVRDGEPHALRVTFDGPKGLARGRYRLRLGYSVDLRVAGELVPDGAMWRLTWTSPVAPEGYDAAHVVVGMPGASTEPYAARVGADVPDDGTVTSLRHGIARDELDLARPHIPRGEAATWSMRIGPHAFAGLRTSSARLAPSTLPAPVRRPGLLALATLGVLALAYAGLVWAKVQELASACRLRGVRVWALLPLGRSTRAVVAGGALVAGVGVQLAGMPTAGAFLVVLAMTATVLGVTHERPAPRGPGRWLALRSREAFATPARARFWFDWGTGAGKLLLGALAALGVVGAALAQRFHPSLAYLVGLDALVLVPLFATGRRIQLPPVASQSFPLLRALLGRLARSPALRVTPWGRVPLGAADPDEMRLLVLPRVAMPGVVGIEVGLAWWRGSRAYVPMPEVLVRVHEASAASARMTTLARFAKPVPGRRPEERVYRLAPRLPTRWWTRALVERLASELVDRRGPEPSGEGWPGQERRLPPAERARRGALAAA